eukprot:3151270-Rhodomonas_salina.1
MSANPSFAFESRAVQRSLTVCPCVKMFGLIRSTWLSSPVRTIDGVSACVSPLQAYDVTMPVEVGIASAFSTTCSLAETLSRSSGLSHNVLCPRSDGSHRNARTWTGSPAINVTVDEADPMPYQPSVTAMLPSTTQGVTSGRVMLTEMKYLAPST